MRFDFLVKLKDQGSTVISSVVVKCCMRDLICDVNYCVWPAKLRYGLHNI